MSEKKWAYQEIIEISTLKQIITDFNMASDLEVNLYDKEFTLLVGDFPFKKICSHFIELNDKCAEECQFCNNSALKRSDYLILKCSKGFSYFIVPVKDNYGAIIANIISEPVFLTKIEKQHFVRTIKENSTGKIKTHNLHFDVLCDYSNQIDVISREKLEAKARMLANSLKSSINHVVEPEETDKISMLLEENRALKNKSVQRINSIDALTNISRCINNSSDISEIFANISKAVSKIFNVNGCAIFTCSPDNFKLNFTAGEDTYERLFACCDDAECGSKSELTPVQFAVKNKKSVLIKNIAEERHFKFLPEIYKFIGSLSVTIIKFKDELIGVMVIAGDKNSSPFTDDDTIVFDAVAYQLASAFVNSKFYAEAHQKLERLTALNQVSNIINSTLELDKLLSMTIKLISEVMKVEICSLMLLNQEKTKMKIVMAHGLEESIIRNAEIKVGEGISGYVVKSGKPLLITDISRDKRFSRRTKGHVDYKTKSVLSVPLIIKDNIMGVINVNNKISTGVFNNDDLKLLETLAAQIANAIENAKLYNRMQQKVVELTTLHKLGMAINSSLDLKNVISQIINNIISIFDADIASLMLWDDTQDHLRVIAHHGLPENYLKDLTFRPGEGVAGKVAQKGVPMIVINTHLENDYKKHNILHDNVPKSLICAPIFVKKRVEGVICCEKKLCGITGIPFTNENLELLTTMSCHAAVAIENANLYNDLMRVYLETIQSLATALDAKDSYTHGHSRRVTALALAIAAEMRLSENEVNKLRHAALLHDIGKIGIAENILQKPSKLSDDEFTSIKNHPVMGAKILESVEFLQSVCMQIKHHHEKFDGTGYPAGLKGDKIPLGSRIITIADTYDAMTSTRPYRQGLSHEVAVNEIKRCSGTQFDPEIVDAFLAISNLCPKIVECPDYENIITISGIKSMIEGAIKPISLF